MVEQSSEPEARHSLCCVLDVLDVAERNLQTLIAIVHETLLHLLKLLANSIIGLHIAFDKGRALGVDLLVKKLVFAFNLAVCPILFLVQLVETISKHLECLKSISHLLRHGVDVLRDLVLYLSRLGILEWDDIGLATGGGLLSTSGISLGFCHALCFFW